MMERQTIIVSHVLTKDLLAGVADYVEPREQFSWRRLFRPRKLRSEMPAVVHFNKVEVSGEGIKLYYNGKLLVTITPDRIPDLQNNETLTFKLDDGIMGIRVI